MSPEEVLARALERAARRYRMPPLPADADAAAAAGTDAALAFAIEAVRMGNAATQERELFTRSLARLVTQALAGDAAFQALVLREQDAQVATFVELAAGEAADRRRVASLVDAFAHPGKLRGRAPDAPGEGLAALHALARAGEWQALRTQARSLAGGDADDALRAQLATVLADPALARLLRAAGLRQAPAVQRYLALLAAQGPLAGTEAAAQRGREAARAGDAVEAQVLQAFATIAGWMDAPHARRHRAAQGLRPAGGFPPAPHGAKDEWDVALLRDDAAGACELLLLAECKAAPAAAASDWPRLLGGLAHLAQAAPDEDVLFAAGTERLRVHGASLRALAPRDGAIPPQVFYACCVEEQRVPLLSAAARALLLQERACIAFARELAQGTQPAPEQLQPVFEALARERRLRPVLLQDDTARRAREAMLHPADLLAAAAEAFGVPGAQGRPRNT
ncbi:hypothetical protein H8N03_12845 [Ramlibacter sp. USB13]|uniref:3-deoxy-D-arabino-heptulosonate 7-phosphate synthase n=1 Tax=Ramlibacter cellulosilyticus TaxID=2764187 RepID=A0A923SBF4_9BURK|nr:hypothetical protein [Ramlibacter cellulosilyticus]MBC5783836.1 hypothetical protein [Ramlibacter cellulosilyticus]